MATNQHTHQVLIKFEEDEDECYPRCPHGPMLHFYYAHTNFTKQKHQATKGFYACSAYRDKRQCDFFIPAGELNQKHLDRVFEPPLKKYRHLRELIKTTSLKDLFFCHDCHEPGIVAEKSKHDEHNLQFKLTEKHLKDPTSFLRPFDNDSAHAQYFFDDKALQFFLDCFNNLQVDKVLCIGAPRLHFYLRNLFRANKTKIESFLLDFDHRFYYFLDDDEYAWYNMCNNYFFDNLQKENFEKFMQMPDFATLLLFTDPPFAVRTEVIANTLQKLTQTFNKLNNRLHQPLPTFWIFPYFSENYIKKCNSEMEMCDFKVNYTNHEAYTNTGSKKRFYGSPVRVFTNVPLQSIKLPLDGYKFCSVCDRYTAKENLHCKKCKICPSKNGSTYKHCDLCGICVKPSYMHCQNCRRCTQIENHDCETYQTQQQCRICLRRGHIEPNCTLVNDDKTCKPARYCCRLCKGSGHNERRCKYRTKYLHENSFLNH